MTVVEHADLLKTAHHEAAHAVVSEHLLGRPALISIERRRLEGGSVIHEGRCSYLASDGDDERVIALAGAIGEVIHDHGGHHRVHSGVSLWARTRRAISPADWRGAAGFTVRDLDQCLALVERLWPAVTARAQREVAHFLASA